MMVEAGAQEVTEEQMVGALDAGHTAIKQIVATIDDLAKAAGKKKLRHAGQGVQPRRSTARSRRRCYVPLSDAMRIKDKLESYGRVDQVLADLVASVPEAEVERRLEAKKIFKGLKEKVLRDEILERGHRLDGRKFDEIRAIWSEVHGAAARPRLGGLHARRDAGAGHGDARHRRRPAEDRDHGRRDVQAVHAALQLPAVLGRRDRASCAARAVAKWATARSPSGRSRR